MPIKTYRPTTQTLRYRTTLVNDGHYLRPTAQAIAEPKQRPGGRRNSGDTTMRFIGGGHKRKLRLIDFKRDKTGIPATVDPSNTIPTARRALHCWPTRTARSVTFCSPMD